MKPSKVSIIGQGYVGLPLAMAIAEAGHEVIGFDLNAALANRLNSGLSHIEDVSSSALKGLISESKYKASSNPSDLAGSDIAIIAVPTPLNENREPDVSFVISASELLGKNLTKSTLIINESTSYPGTLRDVIVKNVEENSQPGIKHLYAISPERVDPGNPNWKIKNTPRLFSGLTAEAGAKLNSSIQPFATRLLNYLLRKLLRQQSYLRTHFAR